jgi:uncharacterized protein
MRIAIDIDSTLHHHWPLVAAAARRRFGVDLPYAGTERLLADEQLQLCVEDTHADAVIAAAMPYPGAVAAVNAWADAGHQIHVASHRAERSAAATQRWLEAIGLRHHALYCGDDKVAYGRRAGIGLLIDDTPKTLVAALAAGIAAATLWHPWNADLCSGGRVVCAPDWPALARALEPILAAAPSLD